MLEKITFPPEHDPRVSALYVLNEIDLKAPPEIMWQLLMDAENRASYFPPENRILGGRRALGQNTRYRRVTVGFTMRCVVTEFESLRKLTWAATVDGYEAGSSAVHGWVITPTEYASHLLTEETSQGLFFVEEIGRKSPVAFYKYHQDWVELFAEAAAFTASCVGGARGFDPNRTNIATTKGEIADDTKQTFTSQRRAGTGPAACCGGADHGQGESI